MPQVVKLQDQEHSFSMVVPISFYIQKDCTFSEGKTQDIKPKSLLMFRQ